MNLISVNPDLSGDFGHHLHFDRLLNEVVNQEGGCFISLTNRVLEPSVRILPWARPTFTHNSWTVRRPRASRYVKTFKAELHRALNAVRGRFAGVHFVVYMYTGHLEHLRAIIDVAGAVGKDFRFVVNLFWHHFDVTDRRLPQRVRGEILAARNQGLECGVYPVVDTLEFEDVIKAGFDIQPMFSTTLLRPDDIRAAGARRNLNGTSLSVYCPGNARVDKGFDVMCRAIDGVKCGPDAQSFHFLLRETSWAGIHRTTLEHLEKVRHSVTILTGVLSPTQYREQIARTDVVLIPYRRKEFGTRTSGAFSDAVLLHRPVVCTRGTWMGNYVERYGNGVTFKDGDAADMTEALHKVKRDYAVIWERCRAVQQYWLEHHNIPRFLKFLNRVTYNQHTDLKHNET